MQIFVHFPYTGREQSWTVPEGVSSATFECWGAAGGIASPNPVEGKDRQTVGGDGPRNTFFYNGPTTEGQLGVSFANNAGYAKGDKTVNEGETYHIYVGGNGAPGHSTIRRRGSTYYVGVRGGAGGWNGGGAGGTGALVYQNLYNGPAVRWHFKGSTMPRAAKSGEYWYDTSTHLLKRCNTTYASGAGSASKWTQITKEGPHFVGSSGGGGGGATDIRYGGTDTTDRIMVAGGGGGAGGSKPSVGTSGWTPAQAPATPVPPFGTDTTGTGATGPDKTWATAISYLTGGWGYGGVGGNSGPTPTAAPTPDGGSATPGGSGGPSSGPHAVGVWPGPVSGSGGSGGGVLAGGRHGSGGSNATSGSLAQGGAGANATGSYDAWCAGGGGGGGGYYGGGGGGQGFLVASSDTKGGGGGGGSNYVSQAFTHPVLAGCARPPMADGHSGTGANGLGGFARISYRQPPKVSWSSVPTSVAGGASFDAAFTYAPAVVSGKGISHYTIGTSATSTDTAPTAQTTVMVNDPTKTAFSWTFTAPAAGSTEAIFVKVTDLDGDSSGWLKHTVTGADATVTDGATITSPAAGGQFVSPLTVDWTYPHTLVAYKVGLIGYDLVLGRERVVPSNWRRGGSRVNLALDPGFKTASVWSSSHNTGLVSDTTYPGASGSNGKIAWTLTDDYSAEQHTTSMDNLLPGTTYRLHLGVASNVANDARPVAVQVWDQTGLLATAVADLSSTAAGAYDLLDLTFTPHTQGVYVTVKPSATGITADPEVDFDFEDGTIDGFSTGVIDTTYAFSGVNALKVTAASTQDVTASLTTGAGSYVAECQVYVPSASTTDGTLQVTTAAGGTATTATRDAWQTLRLPFTWDGTGTVVLGLNGDATGHWYDDIKVFPADPSNPAYGNTDSGQIHYLSDYLIEIKTEEDAAGFQAWFYGASTNGSWSGAANLSPSILTGSNVLTGQVVYTGDPLSNGSLYLTTLSTAGAVQGHNGTQVKETLVLNPSIPATPTVALQVDQTTGLMTLTVNANDGAATYKTVSFDIFRNGTRIATGLTPDGTTRQATFIDVPGHNESATYKVRAWDSQGGYADQTDGSVTVVS